MATMVPYGRRGSLGDWFGTSDWINAMNELAGAGRPESSGASF